MAWHVERIWAENQPMFTIIMEKWRVWKTTCAMAKAACRRWQFPTSSWWTGVELIQYNWPGHSSFILQICRDPLGIVVVDVPHWLSFLMYWWEWILWSSKSLVISSSCMFTVSGMPHDFSGSSLVTSNEWPYKPGPRLKKPCTAASAATGLWWKNHCYIDRDLYQLVNKVWISFEGFHGDGSNSQNRRFMSSHQSFQQKQFHDHGVFGPAKIRKCAQWHRAHSCHADLSQLFRIVYTIYIALTDIDINDILVFIAKDMNSTLTYWCVLHRIRCQCNYSKHE